MSQLCFRAWLLLPVLSALPPAFGQRVVVALDGEWQIEDSVSADQIPQSWTHSVPVPGLAHSARPAFPDVDQFDSKEVISYPGAYTCDNFQDAVNLKLKVGERRPLVVMMVNDESTPASGTLTLTLQRRDGKVVTKCEAPFQLAALGQQTYDLDISVPDSAVEGEAVLIAAALKTGGSEPTLSRRQLWIVKK